MNINKLKGYCINLERAIDRHKNAENEYQRLGIPFEFIKAVDGNSLTKQDIIKLGYDETAAKRLRNIYHKRGLSRTDIGCALSHIKTYQRIKEEKTPIAFISEDDAIFSFGKNYLNKILDELPNDWEICYLFHRGLLKRISHHICKFDSFPGSAVCYLLTLKATEKLLALSKPLRLGSDILIGRATYKGILKGYGAFPIRVKHKDDYYSFLSNGSYKESKLKELYHFLANRIAWVRRVKYFLKPNKNHNLSDLY